MSTQSSMQVTIGSTLSRAWDQSQAVDVLIGTHWFSGTISALDGMGVAIEGEDFERYVIRLDQILVVRTRARSATTAVPELNRSA